MIILGIDPGTINCGYEIIKKEKVIKPTNQPSKLIKESEDLGIK